MSLCTFRKPTTKLPGPQDDPVMEFSFSRDNVRVSNYISIARIHTHRHTHSHIHIHTHSNMRTYAYTHTNTHAHACTYTYTYTYTSPPPHTKVDTLPMTTTEATTASNPLYSSHLKVSQPHVSMKGHLNGSVEYLPPTTLPERDSQQH